MPVAVSYPGVYIEELPSGVRTITAVATSVTAFVGRAWRGPIDEPVVLFSYADYERQFGGLCRDSTMSYAVQQFFQNGGSQAVVVRVGTRTAHDNVKAVASATADLGGGNTLAAASAGTWARNVTVAVDHKTKDPNDQNLFNLTLFDDPSVKADSLKRGGSGLREVFLNVSMDSASPRFVTQVLLRQSNLARMSALGNARPADTPEANPTKFTAASGDDGTTLIDADILGNEDAKTGIYALKKTDIFNLLCLPPLAPGPDGLDIAMDTWTKAAKFCTDHRAFLIIDPPHDWTAATAVDGLAAFTIPVGDRNHSAIYFPRLLIADPLQENKLAVFAPCGVVAGIYARTDTARGVWKAPAGIEATLGGVSGLAIQGNPANLIDGEVGQLNQHGINSLRGLPVIGQVVWGARTLEGADILASQWKYLPVRRTALFIEESLFRGTQWVVFEPNDEPLWAQIRLNIGAFMQDLFRKGAFQGKTPQEAYFVKCDKETTTQNDINLGIVNIVVGFAPLKPAEFVVIQIQQIAGQIAT
jgi:Bacteriophage tail sheath protein